MQNLETDDKVQRISHLNTNSSHPKKEGGGRRRKEKGGGGLIANIVCQLRAKLAPWPKAGSRSPIGLLGVLPAT